MRSKLAFDIAYDSYKNQQENIQTSEVVETCPLPAPTPAPTPEAEKRECNPKRRKAKCECDIVAKIALKKKEMGGKNARLLCDLKTNDLHMKHINSNVCKK